MLGNPPLIIRHWQQAPYEQIWQAMREFTDARQDDAPDEIWIVEHLPVYTLGQNGKPEHILQSGNIPIVQTDRGGQVTYHGPGQLVVYVLLDLKRLQLGVRQLVTLLEESVISLLKEEGIAAQARCDAPGVYVKDAKICSIGLRVRRGCSYHGLAFNIDMDLQPFAGINPCGYQGLQMTQLRELGCKKSLTEIASVLTGYLVKKLEYTARHFSKQSTDHD